MSEQRVKGPYEKATISLLHKAEIRSKGHGGFGLYLDGVEFPWHIVREPVEVINHNPSDYKPLYELRFGIYADTVTGADEFNEHLEDEADAARVRQADRRDALHEGLWVYA